MKYIKSSNVLLKDRESKLMNLLDNLEDRDFQRIGKVRGDSDTKYYKDPSYCYGKDFLRISGLDSKDTVESLKSEIVNKYSSILDLDDGIQLVKMYCNENGDVVFKTKNENTLKTLRYDIIIPLKTWRL